MQRFNLKSFGFLLLLLIGTTSIFSQSSEIIATAGESSQLDKLSIAWTLGESVISSHYSQDLLITQGFHQTLTIDSTIYRNTIPVFVVYPNPTANIIYLRAYKTQKTPLNIRLFDAAGKLLSEEPMTDTEYTKDLSSYSAGTYLLILFTNTNEKLKTYKILKY